MLGFFHIIFPAMTPFLRALLLSTASVLYCGQLLDAAYFSALSLFACPPQSSLLWVLAVPIYLLALFPALAKVVCAEVSSLTPVGTSYLASSLLLVWPLFGH